MKSLRLTQAWFQTCTFWLIVGFGMPVCLDHSHHLSNWRKRSIRQTSWLIGQYAPLTGHWQFATNNGVKIVLLDRRSGYHPPPKCWDRLVTRLFELPWARFGKQIKTGGQMLKSFWSATDCWSIMSVCHTHARIMQDGTSWLINDYILEGENKQNNTWALAYVVRDSQLQMQSRKWIVTYVWVRWVE